MAQPATRRPSLWHWLTHIRKTFRLIGTLLRDSRVAFIRKVFFILFVIVFGVILFIPDSIIIGALAVVVNIAAPFLGLSVGVVDVALLATIMYGLLRFFPHAIVAEQTARLYGPTPDLRPHLENVPPTPEHV